PALTPSLFLLSTPTSPTPPSPLSLHDALPISLALPFSIVGTFSVMVMLKFTLDNLSMMALILSIGFVVDDAIVMLENIVRHIEMGEEPLHAALNGSKEISFTIVSMTISLAAVFIPVLFMGGILGRLFREFAVTITAAILISGFVSDSDNDQIMIQTEAEQGISFDQMSRNQMKVADMVRKDSSVLAFFSFVNGSNAGNGGSNFGRMFMHLKPRVERDNLDSIIG